MARRRYDGTRVDTAIQQRFYRVAKQRCIEIAEEVVAYIKASPDTPTLTGDLRRGYHVVETRMGARIDNTEPYWRYVEFGTHEHGRAQPHVRPAIEAVMLRHLNTFRPKTGRP